MEECEEEEVKGLTKQKAPSFDSLLTDFIPFVGHQKEDKHNNAFDKSTRWIHHHLNEKLNQKDDTEEMKKDAIESQLEKSEERLQNLIVFSRELINNIRDYNERQELIQSTSKYQMKEELEGALKKEAEESLKNFNRICQKLGEILKMNEPMAIYEEFERQKLAIANIIESKDNLIARCQTELNRINSKYYINQTKQSGDICFLVERIDEQIELLKKAYKQSVSELEDTIENEKQAIQREAREKWNTYYKTLTTNEAKKLETAKEKQRFYANELQKISAKQEEITRATKIRLEKDAEQLELQIRKTRANILMNSEKIDYNYQVLQKRNEENVILNNQQKRRVAKYNESITHLKHKLKSAHRNNKVIMDRYTQDIQKLHDSIEELHAKSDHFRKNNRLKFNKVWYINFKEVKELVSRVVEIDRILYEQQLSRKWEKPSIDLDDLDLTKDVKLSTLSKNPTAKEKTVKGTKQQDTKNSRVNFKQLHDILMKISDRAGFLVETRLLDIIEPYTEKDASLVRIENIFTALHISDIHVVEKLIKYFEPYSYCPTCSSGLSNKSLKVLYSLKRPYVDNDDVASTAIKEDEKKADESKCPNHFLVMEPALVLTALNQFTTEYGLGNGLYLTKSETDDDKLLKMSTEEIEAYWRKFDTFLSDEKQNVWKIIEHGLNHFLEILKKRQQLDSECVFLEKQNHELKHLLQEF